MGKAKLLLGFCYMWVAVALFVMIFLQEVVGALVLVGIASIHGCLYEISKRVKKD